MPRPTQEQSERLARLWTQAQPVVSAYVSTLVPDFHQAEEVLQRVAVALVRKFDTYDESRPFLPWAVGIARLEVLRSRRDFATDRHRFGEALIDQVTELYQDDEPEFVGWRESLRHCVGQLKGRNEEVLSLRYQEEQSPAQIAEQMGMKVGAVRVLLFRVRKALRDCIEKRNRQIEQGGAA